MSNLDIQTINNIQSKYQEKIDNNQDSFLYQNYKSFLEELKIKKLSTESINSINSTLEKLSSEENIQNVNSYINEIEDILKSRASDRQQVANETAYEIDSMGGSSNSSANETAYEIDSMGGSNSALSGVPIVGAVIEAVDAGKEAYNQREKERLEKQLADFREDLQKLELSGNVSSENFEKELDTILKNKKFDDIPDDLKKGIRENLIKLKGAKDVELAKVNKMIDGLYDPEKNPKAVIYKDENGNEQIIEFNNPEEAQAFVLNLKSLANDEFDKIWGDAIHDFFGDSSEWVLPFTQIRKLINGKHEWLSGDTIWLAVEVYFWYSIIAFFSSGVMSSLKRRGGDILGSINTKNQKHNFSAEAVSALKTMTPLDIGSEAGKDFLELRNRMETLNKLYDHAKTISDIEEQHKVLREIKELDKKFFLRRGDTFDLKAFKIMDGLGISYDVRIVLFDGAKIRLPILHRIPYIGKWEFLQKISKEGIQIRKAEDFVNYIRAKDIENTDGLKQFYSIDSDKNFTLKQDKLDGLLAVAEMEWKGENIEEENITIYKKNLEDYIKSLKGKTEHTVTLDRIIQQFIEKPEEMKEMIDLDFSTKISDKIKGLQGELDNFKKDFITPHPFKKKKLERQIGELEILQRYINSRDWFGTEDEFNKIVNDIINNNGDASPKKLDGFELKINYLESKFKTVSEIETSKTNFNKFLNEKLDGQNSTRLDKINNFIEFYLSTKSEAEIKEKFEKLKNTNFKKLDDYKNELKNILGDVSDGDISDVIDRKLKNIVDIESSYELTNNIGNFENSLNIKEAIKKYYLLDLGEEMGLLTNYKDIDDELTKISDSIAIGNNYTIGQLTYLIERIIKGESYDGLKEIDWYNIKNDFDFGNNGEEIRKPFKDAKEKAKAKKAIITVNINNLNNRIEEINSDINALKLLKEDYTKNGRNIEVISHSPTLREKYGIRTIKLLNEGEKYIENQIDKAIEKLNNDKNRLSTHKDFLEKNKNSGKSYDQLNYPEHKKINNRALSTIDILYSEGEINEAKKQELINGLIKEYRKKDYIDFFDNIEKLLGTKVMSDSEINSYIIKKSITLETLTGLKVHESGGRLIFKDSDGNEIKGKDIRDLLKTKTGASELEKGLLSLVRNMGRSL